MEEDVTKPSANEREERNAAASSTTVDSRCGDGGRDINHNICRQQVVETNDAKE